MEAKYEKQFNAKAARKPNSSSVDLHIIVDGSQFGTHWKILKENSVFFEEIYHRRKKSACQKNTQDVESEVDSVHLRGFSAELFDKFLDYVYTKRKKSEQRQRQFLLQEIRDVVKFSVMFQLRELVNLTSMQCLRDLDGNTARSGLSPMSDLHQALLRFLYDGTTMYRTKDMAMFVAHEAYKDGSLECLLGVLKIVSDRRRKRVEMKLKLLDIAIALFSTSLGGSGRQNMAVDDAGRCVLGEEGGGPSSESRTICARQRRRSRNGVQGDLVPSIQPSHSRRPEKGVASPLQQNPSSKKMHNLNRRTAGSPSNSDLNGKVIAKDNQKNPQNRATKINQKAKERHIKKPQLVTNDPCSKEHQHVVCDQEHAVRNKEHVVGDKKHAVHNQEYAVRRKKHATCDQEHVACDQEHAVRNRKRAVFGRKHAVCGMQHASCDHKHVARNLEHAVFGKKHAARGRMEHVASANNAKQEHRKTRSESTTNPKEPRRKTFIEQGTKIIRRKVRKLWTKEQTAPTILCPDEQEGNHTRLEPGDLKKVRLSKPEGETPVVKTPNEETAGEETAVGATSEGATSEGETSEEETPKGDTPLGEENPVKSPSLGKTRERLFLTGGIQKSDYFARRVVLEYDPINGVYINHSAMKTSRYNHGMAQVGRDIYFVGGNSGFFEQLRSVESYSIERAEWSTNTSMREARDEFSLVQCGGCLYAIGGYDGVHDLRSVEKFSAGENSWSFVSPMGIYRAGACAVAVENRYIYATGGFNGQVYLNTVEQYDVTTDTWTAVEPMNNKRAYSCLVLVAHSIYVIGGFNGQNTQSACEVYDTTTKTWSALPEMNTPRMNATAIISRELVLVFGGECEGVFLETVECYNINNQTWSFVQRLPQPMAGLRACVYIEEMKPENIGTSP